MNPQKNAIVLLHFYDNDGIMLAHNNIRFRVG